MKTKQLIEGAIFVICISLVFFLMIIGCKKQTIQTTKVEEAEYLARYDSFLKITCEAEPQEDGVLYISIIYEIDREEFFGQKGLDPVKNKSLPITFEIEKIIYLSEGNLIQTLNLTGADKEEGVKRIINEYPKNIRVKYGLAPLVCKVDFYDNQTVDNWSSYPMFPNMSNKTEGAIVVYNELGHTSGSVQIFGNCGMKSYYDYKEPGSEIFILKEKPLEKPLFIREIEVGVDSVVENTSFGGESKTSDCIIVIATKGLNIRKGPGDNYDIIGTITYQEKATKIDESKGWYKIKCKGGTVGWICSGMDGEIWVE